MQKRLVTRQSDEASLPIFRVLGRRWRDRSLAPMIALTIAVSGIGSALVMLLTVRLTRPTFVEGQVVIWSNAIDSTSAVTVALAFTTLLSLMVAWFVLRLMGAKQVAIHELRREQQEAAVQRRGLASRREEDAALARSLQALPDATWIINIKGEVTVWNSAMERLSGVLASDMLGKGNYEHALPFYGERRPLLIDWALDWDVRSRDHYVSVQRDEEGYLSAESQDPRGRWLAGSARALYDGEGHLVGAIETVRDITDQKEHALERIEMLKAAEEDLAGLEEYRLELETVQRTALFGTMTVDSNLVIRSANPAAGEMFGYGVTDLVGRRVTEIGADDENWFRHEAAVRHYWQAGNEALFDRVFEGTARRRDQTAFPIALRLSEITRSGEPLLAYSLQNLSERNIQREGLDEKENRIQQLEATMGIDALSGIDQGVLLLDNELNVVLINEAFSAFHSIPERMRQVGTAYDALLRYAAEDNLFGDVDVDELVRERSALVRRGEGYTTDFVTRQGKTLLATGRSLRSGGYLFLHSDVTEQRLKEREAGKKLEHLEHVLSLQAIDHLAVGMSVIDETMNLLFCNRAYQDVYGFPADLCEPGVSFTSIVRYLAERRVYGDGNIETLVTERVEMTRHAREYQRDLTLPNGRIIEVIARYLAGGASVLVHTDVTLERRRVQEKEQRIEELEHSMGLDTLSDIDQGVQIIGPDLEVVLVNNTFASFYGLPRELCRPGTLYTTLVRYVAEMGVFGEVDVEQEVANRTAMVRRGDSYTTEFSLADGRVILGRGRSLRGGGYLLLHTDVTETRRREKEKEHRIEELESRIGLEALDHVGVGVNIVDGDFNYLYSNEHFQSIYGLDVRLTSPGVSFESVARSFAEKGFYGEGEVEELVLSRMAFVRSQEAGRVDVKLPCGRVMNVLSQRLGSGGYLFIHTDVTEERQEIDRLRWSDRVTGLPNANEMRARGKERLLKAQEVGAGVAVLQVQIDRFSRINETYTATVGDELLAQVATRIKGAVRGVDFVARGGSYQFVVVAAAPNPKLIAAQITSAIRMVMIEPFNLLNVSDAGAGSVVDKVRLTSSLGVAVYPKDGDDFDQLIHKSGLALRAVIEKGGDACLDFGWEVTRRRDHSRDLVLEAQLREAIETQQLTLYYQPQVSLVDETVIGAEALVRWKHPERGIIPPDEFIPMAEETQLIIPMGDWILDEACRQASEWRASGLPDLTVSVNLSPVQFRQPDLVARVRQALERHGLQGIDLELEITESVVIDDVDSVTDTANAIRSLGVSLAMDDFGTGYSALSYLTRLPFQKLKIDQSFIRDPNGKNWPIVGAVIQLARELGMQTIAEGVESREHVSQLTELGCDIGQGYLYSRPVPPADFSEWCVEQSLSSVPSQRILGNQVP